jgi:ABC-type multidrug transport system ATPase subunit
MKVRLAFSVMAQLDEPILLVDEVLAVGDKAFRRKCYDRIDALLAEGRTLFMVSHSAGDLRRFCQRGLYLIKGHLKMDTSLDEVLDAYQRDSKEVDGPARRRPPGKRPLPGGKAAGRKRPGPRGNPSQGGKPGPGGKPAPGDGAPPARRPAADDA